MNKLLDSKVYLVGAGPGDPELLTLKAYKLICNCDAIVYDSLIPKELLSLTTIKCRHFFVGKRRSQKILSQKQINKLLVELSRDYKCIVRLKGGDPFMFGRGGEEAEYLNLNNINIEVVPGVTSGIAAPAYFGIPISHRKVGSSITFITGHENAADEKNRTKWRNLAKTSDGIVIYMGIKNLRSISEELILGGLQKETPVAIIYQGTLSQQKCYKTTLESLHQEIARDRIKSPSIVVIGKVVNHQVLKCAPKPSNFKFEDIKIHELVTK